MSPGHIRFLLADLVFVMLAACHTPTEPLPAGAVRFDVPPDSFAVWWTEVENCSGQKADFSSVRWYYVPNVGVFTVGSRQNFEGYWQPDRNSITIAGFHITDAMVVRHEELHAILHTTGHPTDYFTDKCGALVAQPAPTN